MKRILDSLTHSLERHRLVFWYDGAGEWRKAFEAFEAEGLEKRIIDRNEFGLKVEVAEAGLRGRFLLYAANERPPDGDNWLLDLLQQGHEFKADRASLAVQEAGLAWDFRPVAEQHIEFFKENRRVQALKELTAKDDDIPAIRLKMMAVLTGCPPEMDAILLEFLKQALEESMFDPVEELFSRHALVEPFWKEVARGFGYFGDSPSMRDFAVQLFRGANPLDPAVPLTAHGKVFLQRWKDSQSHNPVYRKWAAALERDFRVASQIEAAGEKFDPGGEDTFEVFDKFTLHRLCRAFEAGEPDGDLLARIQRRRTSFWYVTHEHGYGAIREAIALRSLLASAELTVDSIDSGIGCYRAHWWKIDRAYRRTSLHLRRYGQVNLMEKLGQWVGKNYVNNFLLPLAERWGDVVRSQEVWDCTAIPAQRRFFPNFVEPYLSKGQKVFVIVSDALRYEAGADFAERIQAENRFTAQLEATLSSLPSYTQLGMASLLPGNERSIDPATGNAFVDSRSATGTENRNEILKRALNGRGTAIQAEKFLELNSKTEGRALTREHDVIYIYHNVIDKTGDAAATEARTFEAVEQALEDLVQIVKKVANVNGNNMLLVADHGFLFQQDPLDEADGAQLPPADIWTLKNRRFAIGRSVEADPGSIVFTAHQLGLPGEWSAAFPASLGRFPIQGSGKRYVHGGFTPQETVVPVVHIHKARSDDTERVEVEFMRVPSKITTGQVALSLYQENPVSAKRLARDLRVGVFAKDGTQLSEVRTVPCDQTDEDPRKRETNLVLVLSRAADDFNNQEIEIRMQETLPGTSQVVTYKTHTLKLQKPFTSDFDEF
jgi:uncharacterized protein (TIGR02687 family)